MQMTRTYFTDLNFDKLLKDSNKNNQAFFSKTWLPTPQITSTKFSPI
jgi:hypothetical protein